MNRETLKIVAQEMLACLDEGDSIEPNDLFHFALRAALRDEDTTITDEWPFGG